MRRCQRQYSKHPNIQLLNQFIVSKKVFKKSIVAAKIQHYETEINNCKLKFSITKQKLIIVTEIYVDYINLLILY